VKRRKSHRNIGVLHEIDSKTTSASKKKKKKLKISFFVCRRRRRYLRVRSAAVASHGSEPQISFSIVQKQTIDLSEFSTE